MFRKKKETAPPFFALDDSRSVVYDFQRRFPYESYRTVEYTLYHKLEASVLLPELDAHLEALFAGSAVDDGNSDLLDAIIFGSAREALLDLKRQRVNHDDMLRRLIARRKSDREDFARLADERRRELERLKRDYERTCRMLSADSGEEVSL